MALHAGKLARAGALTESSTREQAGLGLDRLSDGQYAEFSEKNCRYREKFGFPFILAVKGYNRAGVVAEFARRVECDVATEFAEALAQIARITGFRLRALIGG